MFKEIVTKAVIGKGKKHFKNTYNILVEHNANTILGCWVINHKFKGTTSNDKVTSNNCVCIVPGICFDKNGYRIGYGKGYYDKYLSNKSIYKIGICFKECLIDNMPHDLYDIKVDLIVSSF